MDGGMFDHPATQENLDVLRKRGAYIIEPAEGHLASGLTGKGRLPETPELLGHIRLVLGRVGPLAGKRIVITAGGTQEPLDPVRVLTNKSSGRQGYALAQAAVEAGAQVTLISAPTSLFPPVGVDLVPVQTAKQMLAAVLEACAGADALIMAAAVADFRPRHASRDKIKKEGGVPQIELEATEDILKAVSGMGVKRPRVLAGFAAESRDLLGNASIKLESKKLDLIAANDISATDAGFDVETNRVTLLFADGSTESLPLMTKTEVADILMKRIANLLE
jgi:phosphopantothenoylcysteine decarboxylase/phosphopantothenate--cysteine ligase